MPNHITNLLEFNCSEDRFREIAEFLHGERKDEPLGVVDFKTLCFHTAWDGVPKIIEKIAEKFPDADIIYSWADEDIGSNVGILVYEGGKETGSVLPENGSRQAFELAAQIMGLDLKEMGFVLSKDGSTYEFDMEASEIPVEEHPTPSGAAR